MGLSLLFYAVGMVGRKLVPNFFCIWYSFEFYIFFYIGMRERKRDERSQRSLSSTIPWYVWLMVDLILFGLHIMISGKSSFLWQIINLLMVFSLHSIGSLMAWTVLNAVGKVTVWKKNKKFMKVSKLSMPIYLFHQQVVYFTIIAFDGKMYPWLHAGVNFLVAFTVSLMISTILMKWKITRLLISEK